MIRDPLRVGVIGVGTMGADHADRLATRVAGATLTAVSDPDAARAAALAEQFGVAVVGDAGELVASSDVDAVVIASPGFVHEEQVLACLAAGKPVLCEKPLTMDDESALRIIDAEVALRRRLVTVGFMRRFDPGYAELRSRLVSGGLGRLLLLHHVHRNHSVPEGFRSEMIVRDSLVHEADASRFLFGEEVVEVTVLAPSPTSHAPDGVLDPQVALFRMAGGGMVTAEVFVNSRVGYEVRVEAVAERGTLTAGGSSSGLLGTWAGPEGGAWGGTVPADYRVRFARAYDLEVQAWADAARRGTVPAGASAWDGYAATAVSTAGMASLAKEAPVTVSMAPRPELYSTTDP